MVLISVKWLFMHFDSCHAYIFYIEPFKKRIKIQINIWRNAFYKERVHVYMCGFLTSSILIDEANNYTGVILRIACFDLNCPLFTCLDFWHRLSSIQADLSLRWAHMTFCWFCHEVAQMWIKTVFKINLFSAGWYIDSMLHRCWMVAIFSIDLRTRHRDGRIGLSWYGAFLVL